MVLRKLERNKFTMMILRVKGEFGRLPPIAATKAAMLSHAIFAA
jgi:hypothetical protein